LSKSRAHPAEQRCERRSASAQIPLQRLQTLWSKQETNFWQETEMIAKGIE
jgi:hypothetical protein